MAGTALLLSRTRVLAEIAERRIRYTEVLTRSLEHLDGAIAESWADVMKEHKKRANEDIISNRVRSKRSGQIGNSVFIRTPGSEEEPSASN